MLLALLTANKIIKAQLQNNANQSPKLLSIQKNSSHGHVKQFKRKKKKKWINFCNVFRLIDKKVAFR